MSDIGTGDRRKPAVVLVGDRQRPIACFYLEDIASWATALAETGQGMRLRALSRQLRAIAAALEEIQ